MELKFCVACDHALIDNKNKLGVIGIFDQIHAKSFPATHPKLSLVVAIQAHRSEIGDHQIKINFVDQDGKELMSPHEQVFKVSENVAKNNFIIDINNIQFPSAGTYSFDILVDNRHIGSVPLILNKIESL